MATYSDIDSEFVALSQKDRWKLVTDMFKDRDLRKQIQQTELTNDDYQKRWREARRQAGVATGRWAIIFILLIVLCYLVLSRNWAGLSQLNSVQAIQTISHSTMWAIVWAWVFVLAIIVSYVFLMKDGYKIYYLMFTNQEIKALTQLQTNRIDSESVYAIFDELISNGYPKFAKIFKGNPYQTGRSNTDGGSGTGDTESLIDRLKR